MAVGRPWYKRSGGDFVMATLGMPDAETKWAYSAVIDMLNDRDRAISDDPGFVCGFTGLTKQKWGRVRKYLLEHGYLVLTEHGDITNPRFERERDERLAAHEQAVEHGREGGKKSAKLRAAGQGEMDLGEQAPVHARARSEDGDIAENLQKSGQVSSNFSPSLLASAPDIENKKPRKTAKAEQPPPQAPCAREEARGESLDSTHPDSESETREPGRLGNADLKTLFDSVCEAAGFNPVAPAAIDRGLRTVEDWIKAGYDFDEVVLPAIKALVTKSDEPTRTLGRFRPEIAHQHAKRKARGERGQSYAAPASPILEPPGEDPSLRPLRSDLLKKWGASGYCLTMNRVRLESIEHGNKRPLRVTGTASAVEALCFGDYAPALRTAAKAHGFTEVWKG